MVEISYFDLFCLLVGLVSLMITIIQSVRKSDLIKSLENQLIAIIGNLDSLCVNAASERKLRQRTRPGNGQRKVVKMQLGISMKKWDSTIE